MLKRLSGTGRSGVCGALAIFERYGEIVKRCGEIDGEK